MVCNSLKECIEKTHHILPENENKKHGRGKDSQKHHKKPTDNYKTPLSQAPCDDSAQQEKCIVFLDCRSKATCTENEKSYTLDQSNEYPKHEIIKLHIDGGAIIDQDGANSNKCDYVVWVKEKDASKKRKTAILIELKGVSVQHAIKQLMATIKQPEFREEWKSCDRMFGRIVCTSVPRAMTNDARIEAMKEFFDRGGNLVIKEQSYEEEYKNLADK